MKIKIFYSNKDIESYENEINEFIKKKEIIDIKHSISSYAMANDYASSEGMDMSTLIMYEEMEEENDEIKDKTTKDGILRLLRESGVPEEKLNEVYNALFEKVKKERIFPKKEIEEWCKQIKKDIDKTGKFTPLFDYL
jgi:hypothetical protein